MIKIKEKFLVIGNPIKHSISPLIHNTFFADFNKNAIYDKILLEKVEKNAVDNFFMEKIKGINVTIPFKKDIIEHLVEIDEYAEKIGAVNTLKYTEKGYIGYNTDIYGMESALLEKKIFLKDKNVLVLGAGGSGYTACFMAIKNGTKSIIIANRTIENAEKLKKHIEKYYKVDIKTYTLEDIKTLSNIDIVINTTTVGFGKNEHKSPLDDEFFKKQKIEFVFDIIYTPAETKLLKIAKNNNVQTMNGFSMLIYQGLKSQEIWQNIKISMEYKIKLKEKIFQQIL